MSQPVDDDPDKLKFYNDGPEPPNTPLAIKAENAYREWFFTAAKSVRHWKTANHSLFKDFMDARRVIKDRAVSHNKNGVCFFKRGHEVEASKYRAKAQACWTAIEGWEQFQKEGFDAETIRLLIMHAWTTGVQRWAKAKLLPEQIVSPPRPHECIDANLKDRLDEIRESWDLTYESLPKAADIHPRSLHRLLAKYPLLRPPVIHGLLRVGETMNVIAPPKVGKSWLINSSRRFSVSNQSQPW